jgi:hypothetical protein
MAPEQDRGVLTEATDVWGIGGVLYETATGCRFDGEPLRRRRRLPFAGLVDSCLEWEPSNRPSVAEISAAVGAFA